MQRKFLLRYHSFLFIKKIILFEPPQHDSKKSLCISYEGRLFSVHSVVVDVVVIKIRKACIRETTKYRFCLVEHRGFELSKSLFVTFSKKRKWLCLANFCDLDFSGFK